MDSKLNSLNWFEIAATDIDRAQKFYENVFDIKMESGKMEQMQMAFFHLSQKLEKGLEPLFQVKCMFQVKKVRSFI